MQCKVAELEAPTLTALRDCGLWAACSVCVTPGPCCSCGICATAPATCPHQVQATNAQVKPHLHAVAAPPALPA